MVARRFSKAGRIETKGAALAAPFFLGAIAAQAGT